MKIKKGDNVIITVGKDKGKTGKVTQVFPGRNQVVVEGLNTRFKNMRPRKQGEKGQKIEFSAPLAVSNVMLVDGRTGKSTRVGFKILESGEKIRIAQKSKEVI